MNHTIWFRGWVILLVAVILTMLFGLAAALLFTGERRDAILVYSVPIAIPFTAFIFDRLARWPRVLWWLDMPLVILSLLRAFWPLPIISGHALFLTYALLTTRLPVARWTAALILLQVVYLKALVWGDSTLIGGVLVGLVAAILYRRMMRPERNPTP
ncbi:MAG: hypothetical protein H6672_04710 [Anaerolineaceae bacterium]|nr:hypothetical protein [Anaerolineaceae bacterium]